MVSPQLSKPFEHSYRSFESYPRNLVHQTSYLGILEAYKSRLDNASSKLFTDDDAEILVPFRDLLPNEHGNVVSKFAPNSQANLRSFHEKKDPRRCSPEGMARRPFEH